MYQLIQNVSTFEGVLQNIPVLFGFLGEKIGKIQLAFSAFIFVSENWGECSGIGSKTSNWPFSLDLKMCVYWETFWGFRNRVAGFYLHQNKNTTGKIIRFETARGYQIIWILRNFPAQSNRWNWARSAFFRVRDNINWVSTAKLINVVASWLSA